MIGPTMPQNNAYVLSDKPNLPRKSQRPPSCYGMGGFNFKPKYVVDIKKIPYLSIYFKWLPETRIIFVDITC